MRVGVKWLAAFAFLSIEVAAASPDKTLDIYFIDVEGGQSTLLVTPKGESLLIDTGWAGNGAPGAKAGEPAQSRDANRIFAAARDAGIRQIDYALITHFHGDHDGGVVELSQLLPIRHFIDHGGFAAGAQVDADSAAAYEAYRTVRDKVDHIEPRPGDRLPLREIEAVIVSAAASAIDKPFPGAGELNTTCSRSAPPPGDTIENPRSTGLVVAFGHFRFLDVGDLTGEPLFKLACPNNMIGPVDAYLVAHHGGADASDPATFAAFKPRIAIMNNGLKKGGSRAVYEALHHVRDLEDVWQIHRSEGAGDQNFAVDRIANLDESTAYWIKLSANKDGSFRVFNGRTGLSRSYSKRP
jgi:competence protein ComEC